MFVVFGATNRPITQEGVLVEEGEVRALVVDGVNDAVPVNCVDELADALIGLLRLLKNSSLFFGAVTIDGSVPIGAASPTYCLARASAAAMSGKCLTLFVCVVVASVGLRMLGCSPCLYECDASALFASGV
jgi:hypothetical protein